MIYNRFDIPRAITLYTVENTRTQLPLRIPVEIKSRMALFTKKPIPDLGG